MAENETKNEKWFRVAVCVGGVCVKSAQCELTPRSLSSVWAAGEGGRNTTKSQIL